MDISGGPSRTRTDHLRLAKYPTFKRHLAKPLLSQMSYGPITYLSWHPAAESNRKPSVLETGALPVELAGCGFNSAVIKMPSTHSIHCTFFKTVRAFDSFPNFSFVAFAANTSVGLIPNDSFPQFLFMGI